jgi:hypothetical protein
VIAWWCLGHACLTCWKFAAGPVIMVFRFLSLYISLYYVYFMVLSWFPVVLFG